MNSLCVFHEVPCECFYFLSYWEDHKLYLLWEMSVRILDTHSKDAFLKVFFHADVKLALLNIMILGSLVSACSTITGTKWGVTSSPRIYGINDPIPKGGGTYKTGNPYLIGGQWYIPRDEPNYDVVGTASWYGEEFHGRQTANGEIFDMNALTAAHPTLPMPCYVYVTNLENGRTILVRVNDRGPYVNNRLIDLSHKSAKALGVDQQGLIRVRVRYAGNAPINGDDSEERIFLDQQNWSKSIKLVSQQRSTDLNANLSPNSWSVLQYRSELTTNLR